MKCYYIYDKVEGKVHIPGCMSASVHGHDACICRNHQVIDEEAKADEKLIRELEKENAQLNRIIKSATTQITT